MDVDCNLGDELEAIPSVAHRIEAEGYKGIWTGETCHDPFIRAALAAGATNRVRLGTCVAIAFARNPMTLATIANDLQLISGGRFTLGLGSQVEAHITRRFSMPWSRPARRMRELVLAVRAIFASWNDAVPLDFRGEFYTHTLMTPFFNPGPNPFGLPPIFVAGVGPSMTEVAGEVADGFFAHSFSTVRYLQEVTLPALGRGRSLAGQGLGGFEVVIPVTVATGRTSSQLETAIAAVRRQIAFYGATPAYRPILDLHGWGDLQGQWHRLAKQGRSAEMEAMVDDEVLDAFAVVGPPGDIASAIAARFGMHAQRLLIYAPYPHDRSLWQSVVAELSGSDMPTPPCSAG